MSYSEGQERPLEADEQELLELLRAEAREVLEAGAATFEVTWHRFGDNLSWPQFELRPRRSECLGLALAGGSGDWIDTTLIVDGEEAANFELWQPTGEELLAAARERIRAVIGGRAELKLTRHWRVWTIVATFEVPGSPDKTSRGPCKPPEYRRLFPVQPGDESSGLLGPRRFPPYM